MRVVLDTNILAHTVPGHTGPARELLEAIVVPPFVSVTSSAILDELTRVLAYPRLRAIHGLADAGIASYVHDVHIASVIAPTSQQRVAAVGSDPDDNAIIEAAIAGQADVIVTRDRHFRNPQLVQYCAAQHGIRILDDVQLLKEIQASGSQGTTTPPP